MRPSRRPGALLIATATAWGLLAGLVWIFGAVSLASVLLAASDYESPIARPMFRAWPLGFVVGPAAGIAYAIVFGRPPRGRPTDLTHASPPAARGARRARPRARRR